MFFLLAKVYFRSHVRARCNFMAKQPCFSDYSITISNRDSDRSKIIQLLEALFAVSGSIEASFDGLFESRSTDYDQDDFIERAFHLGSVILEASKRSARKRAIVHNTSVWPLPTDLTIKVFSMLDTRSTCTAAATCSFFQKCATDPMCYTNIDLATSPQKINAPKLNNDVASAMIERAGKALQSIKLASPHNYISYDEQESPALTVYCLYSLNANGGALGSHLRRLHLHYIKTRYQICDDRALAIYLSFCPSLVELEFVGMAVPICRVLESVSRNCRLLEHFIVEFSGVNEPANYNLESSVLKEFVVNCPKITTLTLQGCGLLDPDAFELVKGFPNLKYVDFAGCFYLTGAFLKFLVTKGGADNLEVMILRELRDLDEVSVKNFMTALIAGNFRNLRHLDISKGGDLIYSVGNPYEYSAYYSAYYCDNNIGIPYAVSFFDIPVKKLLQHRPNFCMVVKYNESDPDTSS